MAESFLLHKNRFLLHKTRLFDQLDNYTTLQETWKLLLRFPLMSLLEQNTRRH